MFRFDFIGGAKRFPDPFQAITPQEMRGKVMKREKASSTSTPVRSTVATHVLPLGVAVMLLPYVATPRVSTGVNYGRQFVNGKLRRCSVK